MAFWRMNFYLGFTFWDHILIINIQGKNQTRQPSLNNQNLKVWLYKPYNNC